MLNLSKEQANNLPKLYFRKRLHTTSDKKDKSRQILSTRLLSNNGEMKRTLSAANTLTSIKYQSTGLMYSKKTEQLLKQNKLLDKEIQRVQRQIKQARKTNTKNINAEQTIQVERNTFLTEPSENINRTQFKPNNKQINEKSLINEIKIGQNRIQLLKKKRDEHKERNQKHKKQINQIRKQIMIYKNVYKTSLNQLEQLNKQNQQYLQFIEKADQEIKSMNSLIQKTKKQNEENKTSTIKKYDEILKYLRRQLHKNNTKGDCMEENLQYLTQIAQINLNSFRNTKLNRNSSSTWTNYHHLIETIKQKLENYEREFQYLKQISGTPTTDQAVKQFQNKYENNFRFYKFINQLHQSYEEKQKQNHQLRMKKQNLYQQINTNASNTKYEEIISIRKSIECIREEKIKCQTKNQQFLQFRQQLVEVLKQFAFKVGVTNWKFAQTISESNISYILQQINNRCSQLDSKFQQKSLVLDYSQGQNNLGQILQNVKKEGNQSMKNQKIMSRQDFLQLKEKLMRKKINSRKTIYKK